MSKKIVIIGAGPIGCFTAQILKKYGFDTLLVEEHNEIGKPIHCTGLVGSKVFDEKRPVSISSASIINTINGAMIHHDNQSFSVERKRVAYVIDRERFDKDMSKGLPILFENKVLGLENSGSGYIVETNKDEIYADVYSGIIINAVTGAIFQIIIMILLYFIVKQIVVVIKRIRNTIERFGKNDLTAKPDDKDLSRRDELGDIAKSVLDMRDSTSDVINKTYKIANELVINGQNSQESAATSKESAESINSSVQNISAALEQLSASADHMSASNLEVQRMYRHVS